jgi:hypothetical protein
VQDNRALAALYAEAVPDPQFRADWTSPGFVDTAVKRLEQLEVTG